MFALDLTKPGASLKWSYDPNPSRAAKGEACCDWVNRGAVYADGKIIYNTLDGFTIALDANSGKLLWRTHLADIAKGETITMARMVVRDKVFVGNSGGEFGVRGWLAALNTKDGHVVWQAYSTGPDREVLIGNRFKPFYAKDKGTDLGVKTWPHGASAEAQCGASSLTIRRRTYLLRVTYWFPKVTGRMMSETLGQITFWLFFVGFNKTFSPMHLVGLGGMPRRVYTYQAGMGWTTLNQIESPGYMLLFVAVCLLLVNVFQALRFGAIAGPNPWKAGTLEWGTISPPLTCSGL